MNCNCEELKIREWSSHAKAWTIRILAQPQVNGGRHDCSYVKRRSALVREAARQADRETTPHSGNWTRAFAYAMENLWNNQKEKP